MEMRIVRRTDHFDAACRFWGELLGCPVTHEWPEGDGQGRGRIFGVRADTGVELIETAGVPDVQGIFLSMEVDDAGGLAARLAEAGITVVSPLTDQPWGHRSITVQDPAGIEVSFWHRI